MHARFHSCQKPGDEQGSKFYSNMSREDVLFEKLEWDDEYQTAFVIVYLLFAHWAFLGYCSIEFKCL